MGRRARPRPGRRRRRSAERRAAAGALAIESAEPEFGFDDAGDVASVQPVVATESHRLIEHLMIAANEAVAAFLAARRVPTLYRVHERPEPLAVERLIDQLASLGVPTPPVPGPHMTPQQAGELAGEASQMVADWVQRTRAGWTRAEPARAALAQAGLLRRPEPRTRGPAFCRATAISPRRSAAIRT